MSGRIAHVDARFVPRVAIGYGLANAVSAVGRFFVSAVASVVVVVVVILVKNVRAPSLVG